jgi:hypothetical protein
MTTFVEKQSVVHADWLNGVDGLANTPVFEGAQTKPDARTALYSDAPLEILNGGTAARDAGAALSNLGGFPSANFTRVNIGSTLFPQTADEFAASITPVNYYYPPGQFERYGAIGNNTVDDSAAVLTAIMSGALVTGIAGNTYYCGTGTINVTVSFTASLYGVALRTAVAGATFLNITASNVTIRGVEIYGRGNSAYTSLERLVVWSGTADAISPPVYVTDLRLTDCYIHDSGERAIYSEYGQRATITNCRFKNLGYAGITTLSGVDWEILGGIIDTISPGTSGNAYGVSFTRNPTLSDNLTLIPRSKNCKVIGMTVLNNTIWTALDTHGGEECHFISNIVQNCKMGVTIGSCPGVSTNPLFGPKNCKSIGNNVLNTTPISGNFGIGINGAIVVTGTLVDAADGCCSVGDKVLGCGVTANPNSAGFQFSATTGLIVSGSHAIACFPHGFIFYHDNYGFTATGLVAVDPYDSTVTNCAGIYLPSDYNTGAISGCSFRRVNAGLGTTVGRWAIAGVNVANSAFAIGANYSTMTGYVSGIPGFTVTPLTDSSGGTPSNTIAAVPGSYTQATLANQLASLASAINTIETTLRTAGLMQ